MNTSNTSNNSNNDGNDNGRKDKKTNGQTQLRVFAEVGDGSTQITAENVLFRVNNELNCRSLLQQLQVQLATAIANGWQKKIN